jgi:hypothetical protein
VTWQGILVLDIKGLRIDKVRSTSWIMDMNKVVIGEEDLASGVLKKKRRRRAVLR